ncbi:MAG: SDR family NAD(P)-dependent oxidoreductase [Rivularia sp. (in: Bacteria)]|nr:SDR family NAD(P)-dependent oxidoreductase [Rivularia sp. MS3]
MTSIKGKTVILTGASRGIGTFIAREFAKKQARIVCISRSQNDLDKVCNEINDLGGEGIGLAFDISEVENITKLIDEIISVIGSLDVDILVNNAGIEIYSAFQNYSLKEMHSVMSVNLMAAIELTRLILPQMLEKNSGHIVNIASLAGKKGHPYDSIYSASKAGLLMWANALRQELANTKVEVSNICPGYISGKGLLADTGIPAPTMAGISTPENVAIAVCNAIQENDAEVVVNGNILMKILTKLLLATEQLFPRLGDFTNNSLGVNRLNQMRIKNYN